MYKFKVLILGPGAVGKTSLLYRYVKNEFPMDYILTIGANFLTKNLVVLNRNVFLQIWDIGGQRRFKLLHKNFYEGANGVLLIFDLTRRKTFEQMKSWLSEVYDTLETRIPFILIGNKSDLIEYMEDFVSKNEATWFAEQENTIYVETSAKTGHNVEKAFIELVKRMFKD
ncbi:MAG: Rab family GTPase [Promethearchaeota archaeon]